MYTYLPNIYYCTCMSVAKHGKGTSLWSSCGMNREQGRLRAGQWVGPVGRREDTTQAHIHTMHAPIVCTRLLHMWMCAYIPLAPSQEGQVPLQLVNVL